MLQIEEKKPLGIDDLKTMANVPINYILYDDLKGQTLDDIFRDTPLAIILLQIHNGKDIAPVGHWIALLKFDDHVEHFDSYGLSIGEELSFTHDEDFLGKILTGTPVRENRKQLQRFREDVNTCGRWAVVRCNEFGRTGKTITQFQKLYDDLECSPDDAVTLQTWFRKAC